MTPSAMLCTDFRRCFIFVLWSTLHVCTNCRFCVISKDVSYNGSLLNCSNSGISSSDIFKLGSSNVSTLILNNNDIKTLPNKAFSHLPRLKRLECTSCSLNVLEANALDGLDRLEVLFLNNNFLKIADRAFPDGFFRNVPRLKMLDIGHNMNYGFATNYSEFTDLFDSLPDISHLTIDSFYNLRIGEEFARLKRLSSLKIVCENLRTLESASLQGFEFSNVKMFSLLGASNSDFVRDDCEMLFQYLPNVSSLTIVNIKVGNKKMLRMMKPIKDRKLDYLYLDNVVMPDILEEKREDRISDRIISNKDFVYIKQMCISNSVWLNSKVISVEFGALTSNIWIRCLERFAFITGGIRLAVDHVYILHLMRFEKMKTFIYMVYVKENNFESWNRKEPDNWEVSHNIESNAEVVAKKIENNDNINYHKYFRTRAIQNRRLIHQTYRGLTWADEKTFCQDYVSDKKVFYTHQTQLKLCILIPPYLVDLVFDEVNSFNVNNDNYFRKNVLRTLTIRNSLYGSTLKGRFLGLNHLEKIDFTGSPIRGDPTFFKWFPNLRIVVMRRTKINSSFIANIVESVTKLESFDIAENDLRWLPKGMFRSTKNLKFLCVASNRFMSIPFDLSLTPNLEILDLRQNYLDLTLQDRKSLDNHYKITHMTNFTLLLGHNQFSCACSAMHFLKWLHHSRMHFDNDKDYICMTEEGTLSKTSNYSHVVSFWRKCSGETYFLTSLILTAALVSLYLAAFLFIMHKTRILSSVFQIVIPGFKLKTRYDFTYDVVIGYASQDWQFIRMVLLPYLENQWGLRVFVHQRDMLQDPLMMSGAVRDSWRTILVITEDFLERCDMAHNVMKVATFVVNPTNPESVIVIVEETVQTRIPDYVLQVVDEDNIVVVPKLPTGVLDYQTKETLKTRIFLNE